MDAIRKDRRKVSPTFSLVEESCQPIHRALKKFAVAGCFDGARLKGLFKDVAVPPPTTFFRATVFSAYEVKLRKDDDGLADHEAP